MGDRSKIEWTDATWTTITGCTRVSEGCRNCYAERLTATRLRQQPKYAGLAVLNDDHTEARWTNEIRLHRNQLNQPLRWTRPRHIFVNSMSDTFHEKVPFGFIAEIFTTMGQATQHRYQVLTKRPERMVAFYDWNYPPALRGDPTLDSDWIACWPHVLMGCSVEDQKTADARRPHMARLASFGIPTWVSYEPALGPVDWSGWEFTKWIVSGGETGPHSRPSHPNWHRNTQMFCTANGIPFFFKQWGDWALVTPDESEFVSVVLYPDGAISYPRLTNDHPIGAVEMFDVGKKAAGRVMDGRTHDGMPEIATVNA